MFFLLTSRQTTRLFWFTDKSNKELLSVCIKVSFSALERLSFGALFCMHVGDYKGSTVNNDLVKDRLASVIIW